MDNNQLITDFENEKVRKKNKCTVKRKAQLDNLRALVQALAAGSAALLSSCLALVFCLRSLAPLSSCLGSPTCLLLLLACFETPTTSSRFLPLSVLRSPAVLLAFFVLCPAPPHLASTVLRIFK